MVFPFRMRRELGVRGLIIKVIFQQHISRPGCEVLVNYYYCIQYLVVGFIAFYQADNPIIYVLMKVARINP